MSPAISSESSRRAPHLHLQHDLYTPHDTVRGSYIVPPAGNNLDPDDYTACVKGQEALSEYNLPLRMGFLDPPTILCHEPVLRREINNGQGIKIVRDLPILPDRISTQVEGWRLGCWMLYDPRIHHKDIISRMIIPKAQPRKSSNKPLGDAPCEAVYRSHNNQFDNGSRRSTWKSSPSSSSETEHLDREDTNKGPVAESTLSMRVERWRKSFGGLPVANHRSLRNIPITELEIIDRFEKDAGSGDHLLRSLCNTIWDVHVSDKDGLMIVQPEPTSSIPEPVYFGHMFISEKCPLTDRVCELRDMLVRIKGDALQANQSWMKYIKENRSKHLAPKGRRVGQNATARLSPAQLDGPGDVADESTLKLSPASIASPQDLDMEDSPLAMEIGHEMDLDPVMPNDFSMFDELTESPILSR